jgi:hypothetical protein
MKASPLKVASVFVGDAGDCGVFSSVKVSPVMVRGGVIVRKASATRPQAKKRENEDRCLANKQRPITLALRKKRELWLNKLWLSRGLCSMKE